MTMQDFNTYLSVEQRSSTDDILQGQVLNLTTLLFSSNIGYNDGIISIEDSGLYFVNWRFSPRTEQPQPDSSLTFSISFLRNGVSLLVSGQTLSVAIGIDPGTVEGSGIVFLNKGDKVSFTNTGTSPITLLGSMQPDSNITAGNFGITRIG